MSFALTNSDEKYECVFHSIVRFAESIFVFYSFSYGINL